MMLNSIAKFGGILGCYFTCDAVLHQFGADLFGVIISSVYNYNRFSY